MNAKKKQVIDVKKVVNFIIKATTKEHYKKLDIAFIGGEPLIYKTAICDIANYLNKNIKSADIFYSVVTNGTMLTKKVAEELYLVDVKEYQITLDGIKEYHDRYRNSLMGGVF